MMMRIRAVPRAASPPRGVYRMPVSDFEGVPRAARLRCHEIRPHFGRQKRRRGWRRAIFSKIREGLIAEPGGQCDRGFLARNELDNIVLGEIRKIAFARNLFETAGFLTPATQSCDWKLACAGQ